MTQLTNLVSFENLKQKLENDEVIDRYKQMTIKVHQNQKIVELYEEYIQKQKELVKFEAYHKQGAKALVESQMKELEDQLYTNPLFNEYIQTQIELNELFQSMTHIIEYKVNKHLSE